MPEEKRLTILLTNDDGYQAKGVNTLADYLEEIADVRIVAPKGNRSGVAHSRTLKDKLTFEPRRYHNRDLYATSGTPADCVSYALNGLYKDEIDIVVSGINGGRNLSEDLAISGTVSAAREAAFLYQDHRKVGIAVSAISSTEHSLNYELAADFCREFTTWVAQSLSDPKRRQLFTGVYFNLNVPALPTKRIKGVALTHPSSQATYDERCNICTVTKKGNTLQIKDNWDTEYDEPTTKQIGSDYWAIQNGYLSLSILSVILEMGGHSKKQEEALQRQKDLEFLLLDEFSFRAHKLERFGK